MLSQYVFAALATGFLVAAASSRFRGRSHPASRTWLLVGAIFGAVSLWLFARS